MSFSASTHKEIDLIFSRVREYCIWQSTQKRISPEKISSSRIKIMESVKIIEEFADSFKSYDFFFRESRDVLAESEKLRVKNFSFSIEEIEGFNFLFLNLSGFIGFIDRIGKFRHISVYKNIIPLELLKEFRKRFGYLFDREGKFDENLDRDIRDLNRRISLTRNDILKRISSYMNANTSLFEDNYHRFIDDRFVLPFRKINRKEVVIHQISDSGNTFFAEPVWLIDMNNTLREYSLEKERLVRKLLWSITDWLSSFSEEIISLCGIFSEIDEYQAKARYMNATNSVFPEIGDNIELIALKNPLIPENEVVPLDIVIPGDRSMCLITGPNAGGKTVILKSLFYSLLMTQCGIPLKCMEYSKISVFKDLIDIFGDESSILNYMSTFSSHIKRLAFALECAGKDSIVFIDEIISGTDPEEGAALAVAVLERLVEKGARVLVSTHLNKIKDYFFSLEYTQCMSVRFDIDNMKPVYGINYDSINSSYALEIALKNGISQEIITKTRTLLGGRELKRIDFIRELEKERKKYFDMNDELHNLKRFLEEKELEIRKKEEEIEEKGNKKIQSQLERLKREFDEYRRLALERLEKVRTKKDVAEIFRPAAEISRRKNEMTDNNEYVPVEKDNLRTGMRVYSKDYMTHGKVKEIRGGKVRIENDNFTFEADINRIFMPVLKERKEKKRNIITNISTVQSMELNVTGMAYEDAIIEVERFIQMCYAKGIEPVRIIHGRGVIRKGCIDLFRQEKKISRFEFADFYSGSDGVTVIYFEKRKM